MPIDIGKLTLEETVELLRECINALPEDMLFETLNYALTRGQRKELGESWFEL